MSEIFTFKAPFPLSVLPICRVHNHFGFAIHPDVFALVEKVAPRHPETKDFWCRVAAEVSDDYRPEFAHKSRYSWFLEQKILYLANGDWDHLKAELNAFRVKSSEAFLRRRLQHRHDSQFNDWLFAEVELYRGHVFSERFLPELEQWLTREYLARTKIDLSTVSPSVRSDALSAVISEHCLIIEGLPRALMRHIFTKFPERERYDPFWVNVQRQIGTGFDVRWLDNTDLLSLIDLQIRYYGFGERGAAIREELLTLRERLSKNDPIKTQFPPEFNSRLEEILEDLRQSQRSKPDFHSR